MTVTAHPLQWPVGWPRTSYGARLSSHNFGGKVYGLQFDRVRRQLFDELGRLGARNIVLSTNIPLRQDGMPYAGAALKRMDDPGIAAYFTLKGKQMVMAQDRYSDIAANMRSLVLAIEGMRQLERHGGGTMMERAFAGFAALPPPMKPQRPWKQVLEFMDVEISIGLTPADVDAAYYRLAKQRHPDAGGTTDAMVELNAARQEALREIG